MALIRKLTEPHDLWYKKFIMNNYDMFNKIIIKGRHIQFGQTHDRRQISFLFRIGYEGVCNRKNIIEIDNGSLHLADVSI